MATIITPAVDKIPFPELTNGAENVTSVITSTGFWFEVMAATAAPVINEANISGSEPEVPIYVEEPVGFHPEGQKPAMLVAKADVTFSYSDRHTKRTDPAEVGVESERVVVIVVESARLNPTGVKQEAVVTSVRSGRAPELIEDTKTVFVEKPTGFHLEGRKAPSRRVPEGRPRRKDRPVVVFQKTVEPPVYVFNEDEVPVWQAGIIADDPSMTTLILAMFFYITNTPWIQLVDSWGSARRWRRSIIYAS